MIAAPASTPITSAHCCLAGVASTSWPVFRSCRLLLAIAAAANTIEVMNSANATSAFSLLAGSCERRPSTSSSAALITTMMPMPDSGLFDEPIRPAM